MVVPVAFCTDHLGWSNGALPGEVSLVPAGPAAPLVVVLIVLEGLDIAFRRDQAVEVRRLGEEVLVGESRLICRCARFCRSRGVLHWSWFLGDWTGRLQSCHGEMGSGERVAER